MLNVHLSFDAPMSTVLRSGQPLHEQISARIRGEIEAGTLASHAPLPSEHALCRTYAVSRVTARRALQTLEAEGLIYRRQGLGSFVSDRRLTEGLVRLTDFAQDLERVGITATSKILHRGMEPATLPVAERLEVALGSLVLRLDRLRLGDGFPMALDRTWLAPFHAQLLEGHDLANETIYGILERDYAIPILSGRYRISATAADPEIGAALHVSQGTPLLLIDRISRTAGDRPVYVQERFYRSDRMAYELELVRAPGGAAEPGAMPLREFEPVVTLPAG